MNKRWAYLSLMCLMGARAVAEQAPSFDAAAAFGARPSRVDVSLAPDGQSIAYIAPTAGAGSALFTMRLDDAVAVPKGVLAASGDPERLAQCQWVGNARLACSLYFITDRVPGFLDLAAASRVLAVNADGTNLQAL